MMKKLILGISIMAIGALGATAIIVVTVLSPLNPWTYNGITGWWGCILGMGLTAPFYTFLVIAVIGLAFALWSAFFEKKQ